MQRQSTPYYLTVLRDELAQRTQRRPRYSLRAFSRHLGIEAPSLSAVLKGRRRISKKKVSDVANRLNLSPDEKLKFIQSNQSRKIAKILKPMHRPAYLLDSELHFKIIAEWEHSAILSLLETSGFNSKISWIASRLAISELRAQIATENLINAGLIRRVQGQLTAVKQSTSTTEDIPSQALQRARRQDLELAQSALDLDVTLRDFSSATFTVDAKDILEIKTLIRNFRRQVMRFSEKNQGNEVFKLSLQFFPLTQVKAKP